MLDLEANQLVSRPFPEVAQASRDLPMEVFASRDPSPGGDGADPARWVLTFENLFARTAFVEDMRRMLATLAEAYDYPVDVEFTANFLGEGYYRVNLVQCRPFQVKGGGTTIAPPRPAESQDVLLEARGAVIGQSRCDNVNRVIYVVPSVYGALPVTDRYAVARLIGRLTHPQDAQLVGTLLLLGPGRWGTTTPSLGVPVSFAEINTVSILCEIVAMREDLVPDVSLGTHFFNELVEMDMLYLAMFPGREGNSINEGFFQRARNRLSDLLPEASPWAETVKVIDAADLADGGKIRLHADALEQKVICYLQRSGGKPQSDRP